MLILGATLILRGDIMKGVKSFENLPQLDDWTTDFFSAYSGTDRKEGVISPDGKRYMLKYAESHNRVNDLDTSYINNVVSEYVSSHIIDALGFDTHNTMLAIRNGELVVACENFVSANEKLIEFGVLMRKHYDSGEVGRVPDLSQVYNILKNDVMCQSHTKLFLQSYFETMVLDALTGNFDRHMGNWGYIVNEKQQVFVSPIYDNGSTLFPALSEHAMSGLTHADYLERTILFPKIALTVNEHDTNRQHRVKVAYSDMFFSGYDENLNQCILRVVPIIRDNFTDAMQWLDKDKFLSDTRKSFYKTILEYRMKYLLEKAYDICKSREYHMDAYERIEGHINYTKEMFLTDYKDELWQEEIVN